MTYRNVRFTAYEYIRFEFELHNPYGPKSLYRYRHVKIKPNLILEGKKQCPVVAANSGKESRDLQSKL